MSTRPDPLAAPETPARAATLDRVVYATGVLLAADDFDAEQMYHRGRLARALAYLVGAGTAAGLRVHVNPAIAPGTDPALPAGREEELRVEPGLAVDRLGRLIEVPRAACLRLDRWYRAAPADDLVRALHGPPAGGVVADVFITFVACERGRTPAFAAGPFDAIDAAVPSRLRDGHELSLVLRREEAPPLPEPAWPDLAAETDPEARRALLRAAILDAWREGTDAWDERGPRPLAEHVPGQDPTAVWLARLTLPATPPAAEGERPARTPGAPVIVDDRARPLALATAALARWMGVL